MKERVITSSLCVEQIRKIIGSQTRSNILCGFLKIILFDSIGHFQKPLMVVTFILELMVKLYPTAGHPVLSTHCDRFLLLH